MVMVWILAAFGLWQLGAFVWRWLLSVRTGQPQISLLFLVQDNEDSVEGLFRQLALECYSLASPVNPGQVLVLDLGSQDQTPCIMRRLAQEYDFLYFRRGRSQGLDEVLKEFRQGVMVLDLRVLPVRRAIASAKYYLQRSPGQQPGVQQLQG